MAFKPVGWFATKVGNQVLDGGFVKPGTRALPLPFWSATG